MTRRRTIASPGSGLAAAARTDSGRRRKHNEDRCYLDADSGIFLVVDGVGGHAAGDVAAELAVDTIVKRLDRRDCPIGVCVREAIALANQRILQHGDATPALRGMSCVLTLAVLDGHALTIGHVGDSRLYRFTGKETAKLTHDHSPIGEREDAHELAEADAMQHARRNEVYRDVGSQPREPDDDDFVELIDATVDDESAILLCSDGLSDMLATIEIDRLVRMHAGAPDAVVDRLIAAANDAGGHDNVTVVYAEGPRFARAARARNASRLGAPATLALHVPTLPLDQLPAVEGAPAGAGLAVAERNRLEPAPAPIDTAAPMAAASASTAPLSPGMTSEHVTYFPESRTTSVIAAALQARVPLAAALIGVIGLALGLALGIGLAWPTEVGSSRPPVSIAVASTEPRRVIVGEGTGAATIAQAIATARAGDIVEIPPGEYAEALELRRDVSLVAATPGSVTLVAPADSRSWVAITVHSGRTRIRGLRIEGQDASPIHAGIRVAGGVVEVDDVTFEGAMAMGVEIAAAGELAMGSSRFHRITGLPVRAAANARVRVQRTAFVAPDRKTGGAITWEGGRSPYLTANLFVGFAPPIVPALAGPLDAADNLVIPQPVVRR